MADISSNNIRIGANISGLLDGMKQASNAVRGMTLDMNSKLTDAYRRASKEQNVFKGGLNKLGDDIQSLGKRMSIVGTLPAIITAAAAYKGFADLQKLTIGLKQYGETIQTVKELAKLPNVGIEGAAQSLIQLRAVGVESELAQRGIKAFANALTAAGKSSTDLNPALTNVVQMLSTGVVSAADVKELANRIPQARKALMDAFGTASGEALTKIGPEKVVMALISELEKIPPVAGGAGMAMEKFGDSAQFGLATLGESIDKSFGITQTISGLADTIDNLTERFKNLSPTAQKTILGLGTLAIALPPLITGVGALVKYIPMLATGFGLVSWPVAAAIAATAAIAGLIAIMPLLNSSFQEFVAQQEKVASFGTKLGPLISSYTELTSKAKLNGVEQKQLRKVTDELAAAVPSAVTEFDNYGKAVDVNIDKIREFIGEQRKLLAEMQKTQKASAENDLSAYLKKIDGVKRQLKEGITYEASSSGVAVKRPLSQNEKNDLLAELNETSQLITSKKRELLSIDGIESIDQRRKARNGLTEAVVNETKATGSLSVISKELTKTIIELSDAEKRIAAIDLAMKFDKEKDALKAAEKGWKDYYGVVSGLNTELQKPIGSTIGGPLSKSQDRSKDLLNGSIGKIGVGNASIDAKLKEDLKAYEETARRTADLNMGITQSFQDMKGSLAEGAGEIFGDALSGVSGGLENIGKTIFSIFGDLLTKIGKALISYSVVVKGMMAAIKTMNPWVALAAGVIAIAAGKALKNNVSKMGATTRFAKAGMAYREMNAIVGDNQNARFDPEMIAPYSRIDQSIKKSVSEVGGGGGVIIPEVRLRGQDLIVAFKRAEKSNKGYGRGG